MQIHNLDFHYHAGLERQKELSLRDYLEYARMTGRLVLGVTDHLQLYWNADGATPSAKPHLQNYQRTVEGLIAYRRELDQLKPEFAEQQLYFGPEVPPKMALAEIPERILALSDFLICEYRHPWGTIEENTQALVDRLDEMHRFVDASGKPVFLAHPFREAVNKRVVKRDMEAWVSGLPSRPARGFDLDQVCEFLRLDVRRIGEASARSGVPIEINGNTQYRARGANVPAVLQMIWQAYEVFRDCGATFVPGSDLHGFSQDVGKIGSYVPGDCFEALGITADELNFPAAVAEHAGTLQPQSI